MSKQNNKLIPAKYLENNKVVASSYALMKFISCMRLARKKMTPSEASVLHVLYLSGWSKGEFKMSQSVMSLFTGGAVKTVWNQLVKFEKEGLFSRKSSNHAFTKFTLLPTPVTEKAKKIFLADGEYDDLVEAYVSKAKGKGKVVKKVSVSAEEKPDPWAQFTKACEEKEERDIAEFESAQKATWKKEELKKSGEGNADHPVAQESTTNEEGSKQAPKTHELIEEDQTLLGEKDEMLERKKLIERLKTDV